ncbi:hypothetical protein LTR91_019629 [Friedmanniomyces endolithicus]|uniref:Uncharacterized protein n=1 Tax=Friedmanniomyces endolithicus TaxID=329885 RepID=A0AAN6K522_9PEZI|nr:hypothetical protein LTR94_020031 [Friedmanniomyces endolithicus]KAK0778012.1 hypothetical protein LTR75_015783 [Friedmanniomyces endolithicus]KAK0848651.1 hypothetical protein LTR03_005662 [Friedmanniomyces endolithicus]KAK0868079.1 hypothetical protein LTS02_003835 [Friedmanniomyces endolithicus]KAK0875978.1 hypothetical protein LTR87_010228 [Friedmanniomyces endolithicus]
MAALAQTVMVVNRSGKVVKSSKHLVNVWNDAKSAYNERKAEIMATRHDESGSKHRERKARQRLEVLTLEDDEDSRANSRQSSRSRRGGEGSHLKRRTERSHVEREYADSVYDNDTQAARRSPRPSPLRHDSHGSFRSADPRAGELTRRHTTDLQAPHQRPASSVRSASLDDIDMNLAYGELPPPLPARKYDTEVELRSKMSGLQALLDQCNCVQHSVTAIIENLQKNPDALAAVALTLGEISTLASKLAPGALMSMKGAFPAIIAILASPEFAIAVGVGVGVTIIAFGGYKIIKKIKAKKEARMLENGELAYPAAIETNEPESQMDELREINHVERWRRGIADVGGADGSVAGTSVEGEFVTPVATRALIEDGKLTEADFKSTDGKEKRRRKKGSKTASEAGSQSSVKSKVKVAAKKETSMLKQLFTKSA